MGGWGSFNYNTAEQQARQQSQSYTGLSGTGYQKDAAKNLYQSGQRVGDITTQILGNTRQDPAAYMKFGQSVLPGGRYGMGENADNAIAMLGQDLFSRGSGDAAARGQLSPENRNAVVGSALQNASIQLIPQIQAFQQAQFLAPQTLQQTAMASADFWNRALGSRSTASGSSSGSSWGLGVAGGGGAYGK